MFFIWSVISVKNINQNKALACLKSGWGKCQGQGEGGCIRSRLAAWQTDTHRGPCAEPPPAPGPRKKKKKKDEASKASDKLSCSFRPFGLGLPASQAPWTTESCYSECITHSRTSLPLLPSSSAQDALSPIKMQCKYHLFFRKPFLTISDGIRCPWSQTIPYIALTAFITSVEIITI